MDNDASPPPVGGLGNYKGVMLCNRPPEAPGGARSGGDNEGQVPFKSMIAASWGEQIGLPPCKKAEPSHEVKTHGPSAALRRHCKWIKELQEQVKEDKVSTEEAGRAEEQRKQKMAVVFKKQRDLIREMKKTREYNNIEPHEIEAVMKPKSAKKKGPEASQKPLWAMTEAEKEQFQDDEADDLLRFAEEIDFDSFIGDLEFRQALAAVTDRAKKLQREQDAFKDSILSEFNQDDEDGGDYFDENSSAGGDYAGGVKSGGRRRSAGGVDGRPEWDNSTACGDEAENAADPSKRAAAQALLEANPQLKAVHSKGSMQRLVEKAASEASA